MSASPLHELASAAGIARRWKDAFGHDHEVGDDTLVSILQALGLSASGGSDIRDSQRELAAEASVLPPLVTAEAGHPIVLPVRPAAYVMRLEDGRRFDGQAQAHDRGCVLPAILEPGYHAVQIGDAGTTVAVAPHRCFTVADAATAAGRPHDRLWGLAVQLYALRSPGDGGIGDFASLASFATHAASHGADAVTISPVHAQFSADPDRFSPYSPSSRVALNVLHAPLRLDGEDAARLEAAELVDWPRAGRARLAALRQRFEAAGEAERQAFDAFRAEGGDVLERHARFEALHAVMFGQRHAWHWRDWPEQFRSPDRPEVEAFARDHADEVSLHAFMQFLAEQGLASAQAAARKAGMAIGLVSDLAVGTDSGGSHCWGRQDQTLLGMTVGAPPDLLSRDGQSWGLAAFSPRGLVAGGFGAYLEMLRAALRHAGGVRIDHAMGLNRLWVVPDGAKARDGAYLSFPEADLRRLIALESQRHRAIVLAEDLGTVPEGFGDRLREGGLSGMRVLWFERNDDGFVPPRAWTADAAAMTGTHDLPTVAGWWSGRDIEWRERLDLSHGPDKERSERAQDRGRLWDAMRRSGAASGEPPAQDDPAPVADAACAHVAGAACVLAMLPIEDVLGLVEQPNLPGTTDEHPNWRRRLPGDAGAVLDAPDASERLRLIDEARRSGSKG